MIRYESECVGCADGCHGCGADRKTPRLYCDECGSDEEVLYKFDDGRELCAECLLAQFETVDAEGE